MVESCHCIGFVKMRKEECMFRKNYDAEPLLADLLVRLHRLWSVPGAMEITLTLGSVS